MALSKDEILDAIAEMSVMDIVELVEAMEEKFGVSAASVALFIIDSIESSIVPLTKQLNAVVCLLAPIAFCTLPAGRKRWFSSISLKYSKCS